MQTFRIIVNQTARSYAVVINKVVRSYVVSPYGIKWKSVGDKGDPGKDATNEQIEEVINTFDLVEPELEDEVLLKGNESATLNSITSLILQQAHYRHDQSDPLSIWHVTHNLNKYPSVSTETISGRIVEGAITYIDSNNLDIEFAYGFSGYANCN